MEYELRVVVEKVLVSTQEVVQRDTLKTYDVKPPESMLELGFNWLRVLDTAKRSQVDQRIRQQLHAIVPLLDTFKAEQQAL